MHGNRKRSVDGIPWICEFGCFELILLDECEQEPKRNDWTIEKVLSDNSNSLQALASWNQDAVDEAVENSIEVEFFGKYITILITNQFFKSNSEHFFMYYLLVVYV